MRLFVLGAVRIPYYLSVDRIIVMNEYKRISISSSNFASLLTKGYTWTWDMLNMLNEGDIMIVDQRDFGQYGQHGMRLFCEIKCVVRYSGWDLKYYENNKICLSLIG